MSLMSMLEQAQGGALFAAVGKATGLAEAEARSAMGALCPAIAAELHAKAEKDEELYDSLLDLLEDNDSDSGLDDPEAVTDSEAVADGHAILEDVYGSRNAAVAAFREIAPDVDEAVLPKLGAISATAVLSAVAQSRLQAQGLAGVQPAAGGGGGGLLSIILEALMRGLMQGAKRSVTPRRRRRRRSYGSYYSRRRSRRSTTRRRRTKRTPLEDIFGEILGTRRR
jgi:hypothetical protein